MRAILRNAKSRIARLCKYGVTIAGVVLSSEPFPTTNERCLCSNVDITRCSGHAVSIFSSECVICFIEESMLKLHLHFGELPGTYTGLYSCT
jgi:hypothetical protein